MFTSCFGLGLLPIAPGTWGSLPCAVVFGALGAFDVSSLVNTIVMAAIAVAASAACVLFAPDVINKTGKNDPGEVVADEVAGQAITFMALPMLAGKELCIAVAAGFLLFRFFDILKPKQQKTSRNGYT